MITSVLSKRGVGIEGEEKGKENWELEVLFSLPVTPGALDHTDQIH